jgi:hypothetical protein
MTVKKSYEDLLNVNYGVSLVVRELSEGTKAKKAIEKFSKRLENHIETYNEKLGDINLDYAATDDKDVLLLDEKGGYRYKKEDQKKRADAIKKLLKEEFEFQPVRVSTVEDIADMHFLSEWIIGVNPKPEELEED